MTRAAEKNGSWRNAVLIEALAETSPQFRGLIQTQSESVSRRDGNISGEGEVASLLASDFLDFEARTQSFDRSSVHAERRLRTACTKGRLWPITSITKVAYGATDSGRPLTALEINDRIGADRP